MLQTIDRLWVEHLTAMDEMRQGIGLQAYGQQDPLRRVQARSPRHVRIAEETTLPTRRSRACSAVRQHRARGAAATQMMAPGAPQFGQIPPARPRRFRQAVSGASDALPPSGGAPARPGAPSRPPRAELHTNKDDEEPARPLPREAPKVGRTNPAPAAAARSISAATVAA